MNNYQKLFTSILPEDYDELEEEHSYSKIMFTVYRKYIELIYDYDAMSIDAILYELKNISKYVILNLLKTTPLTYKDLYQFLNILEEEANKFFKDEDKEITIEETLVLMKQAIDQNLNYCLDETKIEEYSTNLYHLAIAPFPILNKHKAYDSI